MASGDEEPAVHLHAWSDRHIELILAACADWTELAQSGPPYWRPRSEAELRRKVASMAGPALAPEYNFVIAHDDTIVGECSVHSIDHRNRVGQLGVCVWSPNDRHRGHGRAAVQELMVWAGDYLGLHRLEAWVVAGNEPSLRLFSQLGFEREGTLRRRYFTGGRWHDVHLLAHVVDASI